MGKILIRGAHVLTMDEELGILPSGDVLIQDDHIAEVGTSLSDEGAEIIDGTDRIVMPGFVDGHRHMFAGMLRGCGATSQFDSYFQKVVIGYGGNYTPEDTYVSVRLGALESIDSGITTLHGWEHNLISPDHADASLRALQESGLRVRFSYGPPNDTMKIDLEDVVRLRDKSFTRFENGLHFTEDGLVHLGIASRGVELSRREVWEPEFAFARDIGLPITAHVMARNISECMEAKALGPDVLSVHCNDANDEELAYLAECGTSLCVAPPALARSGLGQSSIVDLMKTGNPLCLSVDSIAGCDTADFFAVMRFGLITQRMIHRDVGAYSPAQVLKHATVEGARAVGLADYTGSLTPGKKADLIMIRTRDINMAPLNNAVAQVALCGQPRNVDTVLIDGVFRKRDGRLVGVDIEECISDATAAVRKLSERAGVPVE